MHRLKDGKIVDLEDLQSDRREQVDVGQSYNGLWQDILKRL